MTMVSLADAGGDDPPRPAAGRNTGPAGTTALFVLLIAAVGATASTTFFALQNAFLDLYLTASQVVACGLFVVFGVAGMLYWATPWWMRRRRRLRRIEPSGSPDLVEDLRRLCAVAGVSTPVFLLAPRRQSTQAVAFGHAGRRYVQINAGLVKASVLAPATFRAVVLHELAHLRHRDVDIAMWAVAIWRSFTVTALPLMAVTAVQAIVVGSDGLAAELLGVVPLVVSLVVLTLLVFLTRNAILRLREHHADILSAGWKSAQGTLDPQARSALVGLFERAGERYRGRFARLRAKHPEPLARIAVLDDPAQVSRPRLGHLFGVGVAAAVCLENNILPFSFALPGATNLSTLANVLFVAGFMCLTLVFAVFRAEMVGDRSPLRVVPYPLVLMMGFLVGDAAALINTAAGTWVLFGYGRQNSTSAADVLVTVFPLVVGALLVTAWARSVASGVALQARRTWYAVAAVATVAVTPWFDLWFTMRGDVAQSVAAALGRPETATPPLPSAVDGWYADAVEFVEAVALWPSHQLFFAGTYVYPWVAFGILLAAIVPLMLARQPGRRGVQAGLSGAAVCVLCFGLHLAMIHSAYQPDRDRDTIEEWARSSVFLAITVVVGALAAATVMAVAGRMRVVHAMAAVCVTATISTIIVNFGYMPGHCAALVSTMVDTCWRPVGMATSAEFWHYSLVFGTMAAIPATIAGRAAGLLVRRRGTKRQPRSAMRFRTARRVVTGVTLIGTLGTAATINHNGWVPLAADANPQTTDCLLGRWRETSYRFTFQLDDLVLELHRQGVIHEFRSDGTAVIDFGESTVESAVPHNGKVFSLVHHGVVTLRFKHDNGSIAYGQPSSEGWFVIKVDDHTIGDRHAPLVPSFESAQCSGDTLKLEQLDKQGEVYGAVLTRIS